MNFYNQNLRIIFWVRSSRHLPSGSKDRGSFKMVFDGILERFTESIKFFFIWIFFFQNFVDWYITSFSWGSWGVCRFKICGLTYSILSSSFQTDSHCCSKVIPKIYPCVLYFRTSTYMGICSSPVMKTKGKHLSLCVCKFLVGLCGFARWKKGTGEGEPKASRFVSFGILKRSEKGSEFFFYY